ncbi:hypothetical protein FDENT_5338 [Fusarium denticulatum]|uniref:Uncharacterized protein n=1 Tax=Fusarium denticulatum TaxID=48507 RepID=A0A8H5X8I2_9HYPO|nr:hypothetical protein FDENT_5338 [Fusarium denticulatum]
MSPGSESVTEDATDHVETPPAKRAKSRKPGISKDDTKAIRERQEAAIARILPDTANHPALYRGVVQQIERNNLRNGWAKTQLNGTFQHWIKVSPWTARPELEWLLAALAVHASFKPLNLKFMDEVKKRGLKEWAEKQLKKEDPLSSAPVPAEPTTPQQAPQVKTEPGIESRRLQTTPGGARSVQGNSTILPSIETGIGGTLKRTAPVHPAQPANKRASLFTNQAFSPAGVSGYAGPSVAPQRIVLRDTGTQTEDNISLGNVVEPMLKATEAMTGSKEKLDQHTLALQEHNRVMEEHNRLLSQLLARVPGTQIRPVDNMPRHQFQPQAQEIVSLQHVNHQPRTYFYHPGRESGNSGQMFTFD